MKTHDKLHGGTRKRLAELRAYVDKWNAESTRRTTIDWRTARGFGVGSIAVSTDAPKINENCAVIPTRTLAGFRNAGFCDEIVSGRSISHRGWYADDMQDEVYRGQVWQLPTRCGELQFVAGYAEPSSGYVILSASHGRIDLFDDLKEAARAANDFAERQARDAREYNERWSAAAMADDERTHARVAMRELRRKHAAVALAARAWQTPADDRQPLLDVAKRLRAEFHEALQTVRSARETIAETGITDFIEQDKQP